MTARTFASLAGWVAVGASGGAGWALTVGGPPPWWFVAAAGVAAFAAVEVGAVEVGAWVRRRPR